MEDINLIFIINVKFIIEKSIYINVNTTKKLVFYIGYIQRYI